MNRNNFLTIFLDGVGIGEKNPDKNIFFKKNFRFICENFNETPSLDNPIVSSFYKYIFPLDAVMGVEGLPQSGTGQTSLLCGINAQKELGYHFGPYPHSSQLDFLKEKSLFALFKDLKKNFYFANSYPKIYFDHLKKSNRVGAFALSYRYADGKLNRAEELRKGAALSAEIDNSRWIEKLGYKLKKISPSLAAKRLLRIAEKNDFVLYEYFFTDHLGHGRHKEYFEQWLNTLDFFLYEILKNLNYSKTTLLICSDHGNIEDLSIKTHTKNPAFFLAAGKYAKIFFEKCKDLSDIKKVFELIYV